MQHINADTFLETLRDHGITFFTGVPDSLLKELTCSILSSELACLHVAAPNEGSAIALAAGHHLGTGGIAAVYMQNSGLGNAVNPLVSLADKQVYRIPMLLIIGWRGQPGIHDEPQHMRQGAMTCEMLELMGIPYWHLKDAAGQHDALDHAFRCLEQNESPVALLVSKDAFAPAPLHVADKHSDDPGFHREDAMRIILEQADETDLLLSTTGKTSRELFELRKARGESPRDFLTIGSMGHVGAIALGMAIAKPERNVICLDGDGAVIMHMGTLSTIGAIRPRNLIHVMLNNESYESVGGQPTHASGIDWEALVLSLGYQAYYCAGNEADLHSIWCSVADRPGPVFLELRICQGSRSDLGRPTSTPAENKHTFMEHVRVK